MTQVFIDGAHGTTGLEIAERLAGRPGMDLISSTKIAAKTPKPVVMPSMPPMWSSSAYQTMPRATLLL